MVYGLVLRIRHFLFDKGWKKSFSAAVPTVCVGNIAVGGTGKTPHTELILRKLLEAGRQPAVLSRGYKRKLKGFQLVPQDGTATLYGDEPVQIARKFPQVTVAVDKDRVRGCAQISGANVIVLDDAFQYRRLQATESIVLSDYNKPLNKERLLPWGRLRDLPSRIRKASLVVVTKCPPFMEDEDRRHWRKILKLRQEQPLYFTTIRYCEPEPVFPEGDKHYLYAQQAVVVSGIADDTPLRKHLSDKYKLVGHLRFPDHHSYGRSSIRTIRNAAKAAPFACLFTTEKDARRLQCAKDVPQELRRRLFYLPIEAAFLSAEEEAAFTGELLEKL